MRERKGGDGGYIGKSLPRSDGPDKVRGSARYTDDYRLPGMLFAAVLAGPHGHAEIFSIDTAQAAAVEAVSRIKVEYRPLPVVQSPRPLLPTICISSN